MYMPWVHCPLRGYTGNALHYVYFRSLRSIWSLQGRSQSSVLLLILNWKGTLLAIVWWDGPNWKTYMILWNLGIFIILPSFASWLSCVNYSFPGYLLIPPAVWHLWLNRSEVYHMAIEFLWSFGKLWSFYADSSLAVCAKMGKQYMMPSNNILTSGKNEGN